MHSLLLQFTAFCNSNIEFRFVVEPGGHVFDLSYSEHSCRVNNRITHTHTHTHTHIYTYIYIYTHVYMYTYTGALRLESMATPPTLLLLITVPSSLLDWFCYTPTRTYTHAHTYTHTHTHVHAHYHQ